MKKIKVDIAVIGGGPAGLAAAVEAVKLGAKETLVIERDCRLGGILNQCIHDGFGIISFNQRLTGGQYAQRFIREAEELGVQSLVDTMVLEIKLDRTISAVNSRAGVLEIQAGAIVLAMGCRERTRPQVFLPGTRPAGVYTAGLVQRFINVEGYLPGKKAVILGSGDIGLIMARRMTIENIEVEGVYEVMPKEGGLTRNVEQCLKDYGIPLHLSTTITKIHGKNRVEGVTVAQVDHNRKPLTETERFIPCDLVVLSVGLIPENELTKKAGIVIDPVTQGPLVDETMMTSAEGIFAAGNVAAVFDLVDYVSQVGSTAAKGAVDFIGGRRKAHPFIVVNRGRNVAAILPQRIAGSGGAAEKYGFFMRVAQKEEDAVIIAECGNERREIARQSAVKPAEMIFCEVSAGDIRGGEVTFHIEGRKPQ